MHRKLAAHATVDFHGIGNEDIFYGKAVPELRQVTIALSKDERLKQSGLDGGQLLTVRVRFGSKPAVSPLARHVRSTLDSVAKVVLLKVSKILRATDAVFV